MSALASAASLLRQTARPLEVRACECLFEDASTDPTKKKARRDETRRAFS